jgi:hypothetical protein
MKRQNTLKNSAVFLTGEAANSSFKGGSSNG